MLITQAYDIIKLKGVPTMKTLILYFSATGNSKFIAEVFAKQMNATIHSIEDDVDFLHLITTHETIAFSYPIYGSRVPRNLREFVTKYIKPIYHKKLIIFCTQMAFSGDGARAFTYIFHPRRQNKLKVIYAEHFIMPNNVGNVFITPLASDENALKQFANAEKKMQKVCQEIKAGIIKKRGFNPISRILGLPQGLLMPLFEYLAKDNVRIRNNCTGCGICVKACPMKNFKLENNKATAKGNCVMCYRCVNLCPEKCITTLLHFKVKNQYSNKYQKLLHTSSE